MSRLSAGGELFGSPITALVGAVAVLFVFGLVKKKAYARMLELKQRLSIAS